MSLMNLVVDLFSLPRFGENMRWDLWGGETTGERQLISWVCLFLFATPSRPPDFLPGDMKSSNVAFCLLVVPLLLFCLRTFPGLFSGGGELTDASRCSKVFPFPSAGVLGSPPLLLSSVLLSGVRRSSHLPFGEGPPLTGSVVFTSMLSRSLKSLKKSTSSKVSAPVLIGMTSAALIISGPWSFFTPCSLKVPRKSCCFAVVLRFASVRRTAH
mmetsp:Transcript_17036/g.34842  ORF Transcript_17036/g.34842 Transcript_17036/m.34842 type:complete len:213 (-) Transcript_17036:30-668(-)